MSLPKDDAAQLAVRWRDGVLLKRDAPELSFDFDAVVDEALTERITQANQELDQRAAGVSP